MSTMTGHFSSMKKGRNNGEQHLDEMHHEVAAEESVQTWCGSS